MTSAELGFVSGVTSALQAQIDGLQSQLDVLDGVLDEDIAQVTHGFIVGDILYLVGSVYTKAIATSEATSEVVGIVTVVTDVDNFTFQAAGIVSGLAGLTIGAKLFLSDVTAGTVTATEPVTSSNISKRLMIAISATQAVWINHFGEVIP